MIRGFLYRFIMRFAHRHHWHYAPPIYLNGDTHLWCKWCGFRQTTKRLSIIPIRIEGDFTLKGGDKHGSQSETEKAHQTEVEAGTQTHEAERTS